MIEVRDITPHVVGKLLPRRPENTAKWDYGRVLIVAGHTTMPGAALLCAGAAARSGVGLVRLAGVPEVCRAVAAHLAECTYAITPLCPGGGISAAALPVLLREQEPCAAVVVGPGLGRGEDAGALVTGLAAGARRPLLLDADGLWHLTHGGLQALANTGLPAILTPHVAEFSRLSGLSVADIEGDPARSAARFAAEHRVTLVLKGAETFVAGPGDGPVWRYSRPNSGLSKGGSGDVLAGLAGGLLAQLGALGGRGVTGPERPDIALAAALCAVWLHGQAGWHTRAALGPRAMTPSGVVDHLSAAFLGLSAQA